jgi:imidazolonepropionase-like amidohydrolase
MAPQLRLINARIIDGTGAVPVDNGVMITDRQGRIVYAGPHAAAPESPDASTRDLGGRTLLPGFIDCHVHLGMASGGGQFRNLTLDPAYLAFETADRMKKTLEAGITTARDLTGITAGYRDAVAGGLIAGPRLHVAVRAISHTAGHGDFHIPGGEVHAHGPVMSEIADSVDEVRKATRRMLRSGADVVKICTTGGMGSPHDHPEDEGLTEEEVRAIVDELNRHGGRPVASHAQGTAGILTAIRGGVTSIEHGYGIDDECLDLAAERGTFLVPTLSTVFAGIDKDKMAPYHYEKKIRWSGITKENISRAIERKALIAMGTDSGVGPHAQNLRELGYMVALGMAPMDAIVSATSTAARLLGLQEELGTLSAGKTADFIVTDIDPLTGISGLGDAENILVVAQSGVVRKDSHGLLSARQPAPSFA